MQGYVFEKDLLKKPLEDFQQPEEIANIPFTHEFKVWFNMMLKRISAQKIHYQQKEGGAQ